MAGLGIGALVASGQQVLRHGGPLRVAAALFLICLAFMQARLDNLLEFDGSAEKTLAH